jgi:hypothetical protein
LQAGVPSEGGDTDSCSYTADPNSPGVAQFELYIGPGAKKIYEVDADHDFTDVPGLGDEAHEEDYYLFFRKGTLWVALHIVVLADYSEFKPAMQALAKELADKI